MYISTQPRICLQRKDFNVDKVIRHNVEDKFYLQEN